MSVSEKAILCIDDEKIILDSIKSQLRGELGDEYNVEIAENAEEGLEVIQEMVEDGVSVLIIVSDWLMPGMKGDEFLINVHKMYPEIVKVMLTGQVEEEAVDRAYKHANLYKVIRKPWDRDDLISTIKNGLSMKINQSVN